MLHLHVLVMGLLFLETQRFLVNSRSGTAYWPSSYWHITWYTFFIKKEKKKLSSFTKFLLSLSAATQLLQSFFLRL